MLLSIISPCYGAPSLLKELVHSIETSVENITSDYEIILVEDSSPDNSREIIREICRSDSKVKAIFLSRNFGQQAAITAGLDASIGSWAAIIDCDLQNPPQYIKSLYEKAQEGYDIVFASRQERHDSSFTVKGSKLFNSLMGFLTDTKQDESVAEYVLYSRKAINALHDLGDHIRYYPLMNNWVGFKTARIDVPHDVRKDGKQTSFTSKGRIALALKIATSFSTKPLHLIVCLGLAVTVCTVIAAICGLIAGTYTSGWFSLSVSLWFIAGLIITVLGLIATYIGHIYEEVKNRPSYIVDETLNMQNDTIQ